MDRHPYDPHAVEAKWRTRWAELGTNEPDLDHASRPFYNLMMFPYPSAEGLHVGNVFAFTGADVFGRFKRMQGWNVFQPMGFDAFGIHSENFALKMGMHPAELVPRNIANFTRQLTDMGGMFAWNHALTTTDPRYYKWTQWIFLQLFKRGLAYKKNGAVNWCPNDKTVLANEQVIAGACERCGATVERRVLEQWYFRITDYAERLLQNLDDPAKLDWSPATVMAQRNWIGRSDGTELTFDIVADRPGPTVTLYTTRVDTLFGATFVVLAPEHPLVDEITTAGQRHAVDSYRQGVAARDLVARKIAGKAKTGVFTGAYAINPAGGEMPIWVADYVLMDYGTGAIMGVPAHDQRDFEFATQFALPIVRVLAAEGEDQRTPVDAASPGDDHSHLVASGPFSGLKPADARAAITAFLAERQTPTRPQVRHRTQYRLYDWCISRQRYWGPPIPIIYCDSCGTVPVPEEELPVLLPDLEDFRPDDSGVSPLARDANWFRVPCPRCGNQARRETDVSDTFLDSAWYFLRYPSTEFDDRPFDVERTRRWLPVPNYIGGNEHAVLHLLYSRFITMVLHDAGMLSFEEPFRRFRAHGLIIKDGAKMSKSKGNVVNPDEYIARWGADTVRTYLMFLGPYQEGGDFRDAGISGPRRFLDRVWDLVSAARDPDCRDAGIRHDVLVKWHQTKKRVTADLGELRYNTAIAALMELVNTLRDQNCSEHRVVSELVQMASPFAPHFAEECWERLGHGTSIFDSAWPAYDEALTRSDAITIVVQVNGKVRATLAVQRHDDETAVRRMAENDAGVRRHLDGHAVRKVVYVPGRLLNFVVAQAATP
ncbi:MAG: leucine--tRNA ligase [Gemmatimonadales bacterium]